MLKFALIVLAQMVVAFVVIMAVTVAYYLHRNGMAYFHDPLLLGHLRTTGAYSLAGGAILFVIIICYRATRDSLQD